MADGIFVLDFDQESARVKALLGIGNMELKLKNVAMSANLPSDAEIAKWSDENYWSGLCNSKPLKELFNSAPTFKFAW